jgi:hypothetical protein
MHTPRRIALAGALAILAACADGPTVAREAAPEAAATLDAVFARAGRDYGVPVELLKSVGYAETRWQMVTGEAEFEGQEPAFGIMALRGERLKRGAELAGVTIEAARTEPEANIRAAAALMRDYADADGVDRGDVGAMAPVVARMSGIQNAEAQSQYVHNDVYGALRAGAVAKTEAGRVVVSMMPRRVTPRFRAPEGAAALAVAPTTP